MIFDIIINVVVLIIPFLVILNQIILYIFGRSYPDLEDIISNSTTNSSVSLPKLSIIVPTKGEKIDIIQGLIDNLYRANWDKNKLEIIIVSDDNEEYFKELVSKLYVPKGLEVKLYRREERLGYKSGALLYGFTKSTGDLILTLDVDARISEDSLIKAYYHMLKFGCDAITMEWHGYSENKNSSLARALMVSTVITSKSILRGRDRLGLKVMPIGCGTIYKRKILEDVGGWDYKMIQDDYELGARLIKLGCKICSSSSPVFVEVPDNLISFYIQQTRWAMGTMEVLLNRFYHIINSKAKLYQKIEIIIYLSQYIPIILTFIGGLALAIASFINFNINLSLPILVIWVSGLVAYTYIFIKASVKMGISIVKSVQALGRLSAYTVGISPFLLVSTIKAFSKSRTYIVTPKGKQVRYNKIGLPILFFGIIFIFSSIIYFMRGDMINSIWLLYYSIGYLYTFIAFVKGL